MLQQLAKEGSSRDSTCSSNSDETGSQGSDESDESEPDVVSRQQHPFGMQNGLKGTGAIASQARAITTGQGPSTGGPAPLPAAQGTSGSSPAPGGRVRSMSPVPVGVMAASQPMTASQLRQRQQQEDAMPSTGYHVPGINTDDGHDHHTGSHSDGDGDCDGDGDGVVHEQKPAVLDFRPGMGSSEWQ